MQRLAACLSCHKVALKFPKKLILWTGPQLLDPVDHLISDGKEGNGNRFQVSPIFFRFVVLLDFLCKSEELDDAVFAGDKIKKKWFESLKSLLHVILVFNTASRRIFHFPISQSTISPLSFLIFDSILHFLVKK